MLYVAICLKWVNYIVNFFWFTCNKPGTQISCSLYINKIEQKCAHKLGIKFIVLYPHPNYIPHILAMNSQLYDHSRQGGCVVCQGILIGSETPTTPKQLNSPFQHTFEF